ANDGVGHAAAVFTDGGRQLGEEVPVDRGSAVIDEIAEDEEEDGDGDEGAETRHGEHEVAHKFAPAESRVYVHALADPRCEVTTMSKRPGPLRTKVSRKRTRPSSMS